MFTSPYCQIVDETIGGLRLTDFHTFVEEVVCLYMKELSVKKRIVGDLNFGMNLRTMTKYILIWEAQPYLIGSSIADFQSKMIVGEFYRSE